MINISYSKLIAIDYKKSHIRDELKKASKVKHHLLTFNTTMTGAIESFPCERLTMKGSKICDLLNKRLYKFSSPQGGGGSSPLC